MKFTVQVNGKNFDLEDLDSSESSVLLLQHEISKDSYGLTKLNLQPGDIVFDIGAHIGSVSIILAKLYPGIKIYAFEPAKQIFELLCKNIEENNVTNVFPTKKAISGESGKLELVFNPNDTCGSSVSYTTAMQKLLLGNGWKKEVVEVLTLEQALNFYGVDRVKWMKIDCEGAEYSIFEHNLQEFEKVEKLSMEIHFPISKMARGIDVLRNEFYNKLKTLQNPPILEIVNTNWMLDSNG